jgi:hypothetical protein
MINIRKPFGNKMLFVTSFFIDFAELLSSFAYQLNRVLQLKAPAFISIYLLRMMKEPKTFNDKILYKIGSDRSSHLTIFADKLAVRDYVASKIGEQYLSEIFAEFNSLHDLVLPISTANYVLKPNHASGAALIVADFVPKNPSSTYFSKRFFNKYYVNPENIIERDVRRLVKFWLDSNYYGYCKTGFPEWAYKNIKPRVYIEELLTSGKQPPDDYRFLMFDGKCQVVMVDTPGYSGIHRDFFTPSWNLLNVELHYPNSVSPKDRPVELEEMIEIAEKLGRGVDHVRVDLYNLNGRIIFGELTNYHAAGTQKFNPESFDLELGADWNPKRFY